MNKQLTDSIQEALLLGKFKSFCEKNSTPGALQRIRTIYSRSSNPLQTTKNLFINEIKETISDEDLPRVYELVTALLRKNSYRRTIPDSLKSNLLLKQNYRCAICDTDIDNHAHADHIVPFKFVGDELADNYQMLCSDCNLKKNASIDFQIRFLIKSL